MNIEKLDTLLRNKLQWAESEVHENELDSLFAKLNVKGKERRKYFTLFWTLASISLVGILCILYTPTPELSNTGIHGLNSAKQIPGTVKPDHQATTILKSGKAAIPNAKYNSSFLNVEKKVNAEFNRNPFHTSVLIHDVPSSQPEGYDEISSFIGADDKGLFISEKIKMKQNPINTENLQAVNSENMKLLNTIKTKKFHTFVERIKPELGLWISPIFSFEQIRIQKGDEERVHANYLSQVKRFEKPLFTLNGGFNIQFRLLSFLNIGSGMAYFRTGNSYAYDYKINRIPVVDSASNKILAYIHLHDSGSRKVDSKGKRIYSYIELPIRIQLNLLTGKKIKIEFEPAYTFQFLSKEQGEYMDPVTLQLKSQSNFRFRSGNIQLGIPVWLELNKRTGFSVTPFIGKTINNQSSLNYINKDRQYTGIRFAFIYKLYQSTN